MKRISVVLCALMIIFCGCSDDDKEKAFSKESIYQTQWKGKLEFKEDGKKEECNILVSFRNEDLGNYTADNLKEESRFSKESFIEYTVEGKIIYISGGLSFDNILAGEWWVEKYMGNSLVLKNNPNTKDEWILTLNKL